MFALFLMFINHHQPSIALDPQNGHISVELLSRQATSSSAQSQLLWAINGLWRRNSWKSQCLFGRFLSQVSRIAGCSNGQASQNWLRRGKLTGHPHIWLVKYIKIPCFPVCRSQLPQPSPSFKQDPWFMAQDGPRWPKMGQWDCTKVASAGSVAKAGEDVHWTPKKTWRWNMRSWLAMGFCSFHAKFRGLAPQINWIVQDSRSDSLVPDSKECRISSGQTLIFGWK